MSKLKERYQAVLGVAEALGFEEPSPELTYYLMQSSTEELKALRGKILSRRKVVYLKQYQSAKASEGGTRDRPDS
jgi:hypothetical protein